MTGPNPLTAQPWRQSLVLPLGSWRDKSGLTLTATTEPDLIAMATSSEGMKWDHGGAATDYAACTFTMPFEFEPAAVPNYDMKLVVVARKLDAAADENADLALQATLGWFTPGVVSNPRQTSVTATAPTLTTAAGSIQTLTTPAKALMATAVIAAANTAATGFARYELDLGARLRAESKALLAGDIVTIKLGPDDTVGATDMDLEIIGAPILLFRRGEQIGEANRLLRSL